MPGVIKSTGPLGKLYTDNFLRKRYLSPEKFCLFHYNSFFEPPVWFRLFSISQGVTSPDVVLTSYPLIALQGLLLLFHVEYIGIQTEFRLFSDEYHPEWRFFLVKLWIPLFYHVQGTWGIILCNWFLTAIFHDLLLNFTYTIRWCIRC